MVVMVKRGKGGRLGSPDGPQGSTWSIGPGPTWTFAPFYEVMTYGQLGRYVLAARWGKLPPPHDAKEANALRKAIANRRVSAPKAPEIYLPEEWFEIGKSGSIVSERDNRLLSERDMTLLSQRDNSVISQRDNRVGTISASQRGKNAPFKDTSIKTLSKDTYSNADEPSSTVAGTIDEGGGRKRKTPPSKDGMAPKEWTDKFITTCYGSLEDTPPQWGAQVASLHWMRARFPLDVVLRFYREKKAEKYWKQQVLLPNTLARGIKDWPRLKQALRDWERNNLGEEEVRGEREAGIGEDAVGTPTRVESPRPEGTVRHPESGQADVDRGGAGPVATEAGQGQGDGEAAGGGFGGERRLTLQERLDALRTGGVSALSRLSPAS